MSKSAIPNLQKFTKLSSVKCLALLGLLAIAPATVQAQKLAHPGGWSTYSWATDNFNDTSIGWQWQNTHSFYSWERSTRKNGSKTWTRFRTQNVNMNGWALRIINWHHSTPITESGRTFDYSGGVLKSKANWLMEGQYQCRSRVQWNFPDVWPTFWVDRGNGDELDIMQYQSNILDQSHVEKSRPQGHPQRLSQRSWTPWMANRWEWDWAMARVRSWTHWAARATRTTNPTFYIDGKLEHTSTISRVDTPMEMLFTSSPHFHHLPAPGNYPSFYVDWVETHVP